MDNEKYIVILLTEYIETHFSEDLSSDALANVVYISSRELDRIFNNVLRMSVTTYVRKLRLTYGAVLLRRSEKSVLDVAMEVGFGSVDGFQRAFKLEFGVNPLEYRNKNLSVNLFIPLRSYDVESFSSDDFASYFGSFLLGVVYLPERSFLIRRGRKARNLDEYYSEVVDPVSARDCLNMIWGLTLPPSYIIPGTSEFVLGSEIKPGEHPQLHPGYDIITVPPSYFFAFSGNIGYDKLGALYNQEILEKDSDYLNPHVLGYEYDYTVPSFHILHHHYVRPLVLKAVKNNHGIDRGL